MKCDIIRISYSSNVDTFYSSEYDEITAEEILNIIIDETKYRPFKDAEECWNEIMKHEPFGWVKRKDDDYRVTLLNVGNDRDFELLLNKYTFADGTPFGLKED